MGNRIHINMLMLAGVISSLISATLMASTLYTLAPAGWMAFLAVVMGLILEAFKSGFSRLASDFYTSRRYIAFAISAAAVIAALSFAVWAGQERFMHSLEADERESTTLRLIRLKQIEEALRSNARELQQLDTQGHPESAALDARINDLYAQSRDMRARMGWTKAEQLEASIKPLQDELERKQSQTSSAKSQRAEEIRIQDAKLHAEQVAINGRTGKLVTTDLATAGLILKSIIVLLETAPIFLFFMAGLKRQGFNPEDNPQQNQGSEQAEQDSILNSLFAAAGANAAATLSRPQSSTMAFSKPAMSAETDASMAHPKLPEAIRYVRNLEPGTRISTLEFKAAVAVGSDSVAKILSQIASDYGLVGKVGRSWIKV